MKNRGRANLVIIMPAMILCLMICASSLFAGNHWMQRNEGNGISFEWNKASFENDVDAKFLSSVFFLRSQVVVHDKINFVTELPFSYIDADRFDSEFMLGNIYVGMEYISQGSGELIFLGLRLPVAPDDKGNASVQGAFTNYHLLEAFVGKGFSIRLNAGYKFQSANDIIFKIYGGPMLVKNIDSDTYNSDTEVYIDYFAEVWYPAEKFEFAMGTTGRFWATGEDLDFGERLISNFEVKTQMRTRPVKPGIFLRLSLDDAINNFINFVYGFNLTVSI